MCSNHGLGTGLDVKKIMFVVVHEVVFLHVVNKLYADKLFKEFHNFIMG